MNRPRVFQVLRITFTAVCGLAAVLLCVLWARSYRHGDVVMCSVVPLRGVGFTSHHGRLTLFTFFGQSLDSPSYITKPGIHVLRRSLNQFEQPKSQWQFVRQSNPYQATALVGPLWFFVLLSAALALLAGYPWSRWRFTLRTLLLAVTLGSIVLGLAAWAMRS